ncbi:bacterio-opsin activator [Halobacteriales archaeon QS_9_68_17]|nr:MAG: bacterio-opsin activator [Halobacteriales archaeon QS_9_68_17]
MSDREGTRVLYVDPDEGARRRARAKLGVAGVEVRTAATVKDGLGGIRPAGVDCVVSECRLADGEAMDLFRGIRQIAPNVPVVLFTDDADAVAAAGDAVPCVRKSDGYDRLVRRIAERVAAEPSGLGDPAAISEATKERAMDEAPVGITVADPSLPDNPLVYVNRAFEDITGYTADESLGRNCRFLQGERTDEDAVAEIAAAVDAEEPVSVELLNYRRDGTPFWTRLDVAPIDDESGEVVYYVGFQTDVSERKRAEREAERERANLEHLVERIQGLLRDVTNSIVRAESRREMEREVCRRLAAVDGYVGAWIGQPDLSRERLVSRTSAGETAAALGELTVRLDGDDPAARAAADGSIQVGDPSDDPVHAAWSDAGSATPSAVASVPLEYGESLYGALNVYAADADAFDERESVVLEALGRAIAAAIARFAAADCRLEYQGGVLRSNGQWLAFFEATDADPDRLLDAAADRPDIDEATCLTADGTGGVFEFAVADPAFVRSLADNGARTRTLTVGPEGRAHLQVDVPHRESARDVFDALSAMYDGTELIATRESSRPARTDREFRSTVENRLTEQQRIALEKAYHGGFFEWPHAVSGEELAASMGISRSTFHQHLRAAERKLVAELFDGWNSN